MSAVKLRIDRQTMSSGGEDVREAYNNMKKVGGPRIWKGPRSEKGE